MAITNKEIITSQVNRINEKLHANIELVQNRGKFTLAETPFPITFAVRTSAQMIEYLAGLEDAIDARPTTIYYVRCEENDNGWVNGHRFFTKLEDAIKLMRNYVAVQIRCARAEKKKVSFKYLRFGAIGDKSPAILLRIDDDEFEYRVWGDELHTTEISLREAYYY